MVPPDLEASLGPGCIPDHKFPVNAIFNAPTLEAFQIGTMVAAIALSMIPLAFAIAASFSFVTRLASAFSLLLLPRLLFAFVGHY